MCVCFVAHSCLTRGSPIDCSPPVSSAMELSGQEYWNRLPFPSPGDLPTQGLNMCLLPLLHCRQILYHCTTSATWEVQIINLKSMYFTAYKSHSRKNIAGTLMMEITLESQFPGMVKTCLIDFSMKISIFLVAPVRVCNAEKGSWAVYSKT